MSTTDERRCGYRFDWMIREVDSAADSFADERAPGNGELVQALASNETDRRGFSNDGALGSSASSCWERPGGPTKWTRK
jgi:hypothetical protein